MNNPSTSQLLLGRDATAYGRIETRTINPRWALVLSRGLESPAPKSDPNEDACAVVATADAFWAVVADAHFGARSAELVAETVVRVALDSAGGPWLDQLESLRAGLLRASTRLEGSSSACAALIVVVAEDVARFLTIGDCRGYRLPADETGAHLFNPQNQRYFGSRSRPRDLVPGEIELPPGDRLVLASDGLPECIYGTPTLSPTEIAETGRPGAPLESARALVERALAKGGEDNVAVVVGDIG